MSKIFNFLPLKAGFNKILFLLKRPKIIVVAGENRKIAQEIIYQVLSKHFKIGKEILVWESDLTDIEELKIFIKSSSLPILVITDSNNISLDKIRAFSKVIPDRGFLISNFDEEQTRELKTETSSHALYFGFQSGADFQASDVKSNGGTNFKINYKGNIVPVWLENVSGREYILAALTAVAVGEILGLNLVEISEALKDYKVSAMIEKQRP